MTVNSRYLVRRVSPLVIFFMIALPKSGIAISAIPLNTINFLVALTLPFFFLVFLSRNDCLRKNPKSDVQLLLLVPFASTFFVVTTLNGVDSYPTYAGYIAALIVSPVYFYLFFKCQDDFSVKSIMKVLVFCVRFAAFYGVVLFLYKTITGVFFDIPGVTTTYGAEKGLEERMNNRGELFKLISTYNNGNIYAVCMIMLAPLYRVLESSKLWFCVFLLSVVLTLSRSAWILLFIYFFLEFFLLNRTLRLSRLLILFVSTFVLLLLGVKLLNLIGRDISFVFDSNLGGRATYLQNLFEAGFISEQKISWSYEIPYVSFAQFVGAFSIPFYLLYFFSLVLNAKSLIGGRAPLKRGAALGVLLYFFATFADAALILVPTSYIFFFLVFFSLSEFSYGNLSRS